MISRLTLLVPVAIIITTAFAHAVDLKDITYTTKDAGKVVFSRQIFIWVKKPGQPRISVARPATRVVN